MNRTHKEQINDWQQIQKHGISTSFTRKMQMPVWRIFWRIQPGSSSVFHIWDTIFCWFKLSTICIQQQKLHSLLECQLCAIFADSIRYRLHTHRDYVPFIRTREEKSAQTKNCVLYEDAESYHFIVSPFVNEILHTKSVCSFQSFSITSSISSTKLWYLFCSW